MLKKLKNYTSKHTDILIRFDDIAENMNWNLMDRCENLFLKYSVKPVLGVIPKNQDKELQAYPANNKFWNRVRGWKNLGWEIVMHGYTHVYDSTSYNKKDFFSYGGGSEFYGHSLEKQKQRLATGKTLQPRLGEQSTFNIIDESNIMENISRHLFSMRPDPGVQRRIRDEERDNPYTEWLQDRSQ